MTFKTTFDSLSHRAPLAIGGFRDMSERPKVARRESGFGERLLDAARP